MSQQIPLRYACKSDLENYFKKRDLLGGLSILEQKELQKNIGILNINNSDLTSIERITYEHLNALVLSKSLIPSKKYMITDFQSIYKSNVMIGNTYQSWGDDKSVNPSKKQEIIVSAISDERIDPRIVINDPLCISWEVNYDNRQEILSDGMKTKGKITYLRDDNNNTAFYDFKNIRFRRTQRDLLETNIKINTAYIDLFTFSEIENGIIKDSSFYSNTKNNNLDAGCFNNIFIGDTYNNIFEEDCFNNLFCKGCHDNHIKWNSVNNIFNEPVCYTEGSIYNKIFKIGNTDMSTAISKTIHKVNDYTILSFLDPITYSYQVILL